MMSFNLFSYDLILNHERNKIDIHIDLFNLFEIKARSMYGWIGCENRTTPSLIIFIRH